MHGHDGPRHQMRQKEIDVLLRAAIGVVAVDPEKPDRTVPAAGEITGVRAMGLDARLDSRGAQRRTKIVPRRALRADVRIGHGRSGVRVDAHDGTEAIALRDGGQADCGLSFVAPDLEDRPPGGSARRHECQESRFALRQKPRSGPYSCPGLLNGFSKIRRRTADG